MRESIRKQIMKVSTRMLCGAVAASMALALCIANAHAQTRARDIGIPFIGTPGPLDWK